MKSRFSKHIHPAKIFFKHLKLLLTESHSLRKAAKENPIEISFKERIMLAVTQVNGCRLCSYAHTRIALENGLGKEEISSLLAGELTQAPEREHIALLFAQHYAETGGVPAKDSYNSFVAYYGEAEASAIVYHIREIMVGNLYGNTFDGLLHRLKWRGSKNSSLFRELGITFGIVPALPACLVPVLFARNKLRNRPLYETIYSIEKT